MSRERINRLSIFIDGGHYSAIQRYYQASFDFHLFMKEILKRLEEETETCKLLHVFYYDCEPYLDANPTPEEQEALTKKRSYLNFLRAQRVRIREGTLVKRTSPEGIITYQQKKVDLLLGLDIAEECNKGLMSHLVLVAGDADLAPAVEFAGYKGVQVWLVHGPRRAYSDSLWSAADGRIEINENIVRLVSKRLPEQSNTRNGDEHV